MEVLSDHGWAGAETAQPLHEPVVSRQAERRRRRSTPPAPSSTSAPAASMGLAPVAASRPDELLVPAAMPAEVAVPLEVLERPRSPMELSSNENTL